MPTIDVPFLGNLVLGLVLLSAAWTFALAIASTRGRPHLLVAARFGSYTTSALVALAVCLLGYAFQTHDYRISYVARYSDRSMPWSYLVASLWGGQDGSLLWWTFLLAMYSAAATRSLRGRLVELQPWFLATLMSIFAFFVVLMLFPANPFATFAGSTPLDGEGLNPLLQNYWMTIHPPSLYMGFVGWSIPFAFVMAALITGKLDDRWLEAARPWAMIAWSFLSLGLLLGCVWSYEELGWGGYWAWDPVENASFMPWLVGTAYLHSAIVQERYGMLKTWNVFLLCLTFFMTIFGTFLTRSGLIASVHSFARSDIGTYFAWYMLFLVLVIGGVLAWRWKQLVSRHAIDSLLSREFAFLFNNWILLAMMVFVLGATTYPLISEALWNETATVGPPFYNQYMPFLGLVLLFLAGVGPLVSWRKSTASHLGRVLAMPTLGSLALLIAHATLGGRFGFPAHVERPPISDTQVGQALARISGYLPGVATFVVAFVLLSVLQEFWRGTSVRMRVKGESAPVALSRLVSRARRRYGGYVVHAGVALMFLGFAGAAYDHEREAALRPGAEMRIGDYRLRYERPRMEVDADKRMIFADVDLYTNGRSVGRASPAKFVYRLRPEMPTTEVAVRSRPREDLYLIMSTVDPETRRATFKAIVRPLVLWIWIGGVLGLLGSLIAMWPDARRIAREPSRGAARARPGLRLAAAATLVLGLLALPAFVSAQGSSSLHAGNVELHSADERVLFPRLLCQCGDCERLPLDSCICGWAEEKRAEIRMRLAAGETIANVQRAYAATYGAEAISVPEDRGAGRAIWAAPAALSVVAAASLFVLARRWKSRAQPEIASAPSAAASSDYDARIDAELSRLTEEDE